MDGGEHGNRGDDGDAIARETILEVAAEQGRGGRGGGEERSDRRLNGGSHGGEIHRDGDGDIDAVPRLRSVGKGQVNDQKGYVGDGHVEAEVREVAAARGERDGPLRGGESTLRPPFGTAGDHLPGRSGRCVALVALAERSRFAIDRGELARVRLV